MAGTAHDRDIRTGGPVVILVKPQLGENIGAAARAMANFGLSRLRLVAPRDGWPSDKARASASGADWVIDGAEVHATTADAIADLGFVLATTARPRDMVKRVVGPGTAAEELARRIQSAEQAGILFGGERAGLDNDDIALADTIVTYPVNPGFASLNLAQAVLLFAYEWMRARGPEQEEGLVLNKHTLAPKADLVRLFEHLEAELDAAGFLKPVEKRPVMVRTLRNLLHRATLTEQEVRTLRGVIVALTKHGASRDEAAE